MSNLTRRMLSLTSLVCSLGIATASAGAAQLMQFGFNSSMDPSSTDPGVSATSVGETGFTGVYSSSTPAEGTRSRAVTLNNIDNSFATDHYYQFTLAPTGGQALNLTSLSYYANISNTGTVHESAYQLQYDDLSDAAGFITVGENALLVNATWKLQSFDLSGVQFDNLTQGIVFRLDVRDSGSTLSNYSVRIDNLIVDGAVVPEPATLGLLGLGGMALMMRRRRA